ncbi:unnamed protein product, partial [Effrenium voratum]
EAARNKRKTAAFPEGLYTAVLRSGTPVETSMVVANAKDSEARVLKSPLWVSWPIETEPQAIQIAALPIDAIEALLGSLSNKPEDPTGMHKHMEASVKVMAATPGALAKKGAGLGDIMRFFDLILKFWPDSADPRLTTQRILTLKELCEASAIQIRTKGVGNAGTKALGLLCSTAPFHIMALAMAGLGEKGEGDDVKACANFIERVSAPILEALPAEQLVKLGEACAKSKAVAEVILPTVAKACAGALPGWNMDDISKLLFAMLKVKSESPEVGELYGRAAEERLTKHAAQRELAEEAALARVRQAEEARAVVTAQARANAAAVVDAVRARAARDEERQAAELALAEAALAEARRASDARVAAAERSLARAKAEAASRRAAAEARNAAAVEAAKAAAEESKALSAKRMEEAQRRQGDGEALAQRQVEAAEERHKQHLREVEERVAHAEQEAEQRADGAQLAAAAVLETKVADLQRWLTQTEDDMLKTQDRLEVEHVRAQKVLRQVHELAEKLQLGGEVCQQEAEDTAAANEEQVNQMLADHHRWRAEEMEWVASQTDGLSETQLVKVVLALGRVPACKDFVASAAAEVVNKMSAIAAPQLLLLTQGMAGLGSDNASLAKLVDYWTTDEVKLKQLSADQLAKLGQVLAPVMPGHEALWKLVGARLLEQKDKLSEPGKASVLAAFSGEAPTFEEKEKLVAAMKPRDRDRKDRDNEKERSHGKSRGGDDRKRSRSRDRRDRRDRRDSRPLDCTLAGVPRWLAMEEYDVMVRLLLLGEAGVGKSCIMQRFAGEPFQEAHVPTIGVDFKTRRLDKPKLSAKVQIWDTAGNRRYRVGCGFGGLFRGCQGVILIFDVSDRESFNNLRHCIRDVEGWRQGEPLMLLLLGNKADRAAYRVVSAEEALAFAESWNMLYLETSAKHNWNLQEAFEHSVEELARRQLGACAGRVQQPPSRRRSFVYSAECGVWSSLHGKRGRSSAAVTRRLVGVKRYDWPPFVFDESAHWPKNVLRVLSPLLRKLGDSHGHLIVAAQPARGVILLQGPGEKISLALPGLRQLVAEHFPDAEVPKELLTPCEQAAAAPEEEEAKSPASEPDVEMVKAERAAADTPQELAAKALRRAYATRSASAMRIALGAACAARVAPAHLEEGERWLRELQAGAALGDALASGEVTELQRALNAAREAQVPE